MKPIIFTADEVRATLDGRKGMKRVVIEPLYDNERERFVRMNLFASIGLRNGVWHGLSPEGIPFVNDEIKQPPNPGDILWTCREGDMQDKAVEWCRHYGLEFDAVNANLPEMNEMYGNDSRKIGADEYWDDKAVNVKA